LTFSGAVVLEKMFFLMLPTKTHVKSVFPPVSPTPPPPLDFETLILHYIRIFDVKLNYSGSLAVEKEILKDFLY
jgi:hypothetical protein